MNTTKDIVPWKCHICGMEFKTPSGGVCFRCGRVTCISHLHKIGKKEKLKSKWVCDICLKSEDKGMQKIKK